MEGKRERGWVPSTFFSASARMRRANGNIYRKQFAYLAVAITTFDDDTDM